MLLRGRPALDAVEERPGGFETSSSPTAPGSPPPSTDVEERPIDKGHVRDVREPPEGRLRPRGQAARAARDRRADQARAPGGQTDPAPTPKGKVQPRVRDARALRAVLPGRRSRSAGARRPHTRPSGERAAGPRTRADRAPLVGGETSALRRRPLQVVMTRGFLVTRPRGRRACRARSRRG